MEEKLQEKDPLLGGLTWRDSQTTLINRESAGLVMPRSPDFYDGRPFQIPTDTGAALQGAQIHVEAPTLVRVDGFLDPATGYLPNIAAAVRVVLRATGRGLLNADTTIRRAPFLRGVGPFIWLPAAGTWTITCNTGGNIANRPAYANAYVGIDPHLAQQVMAGLYPFQYYTEDLIVPVLGLVTIPSAAALATFTDFNWFGITALSLINNGAGAVVLSWGSIPTLGPPIHGQTLAAGGVVQFNWVRNAGVNLMAASTPGTTHLTVEARSI